MAASPLTPEFNMRNSNYLLNSQSAKELYLKVKDLPIYDYHCHLVPKEIYEDKEFTDIGALWLGGDHYKWRLMRLAGIDEANNAITAGFRTYKFTIFI